MKNRRTETLTILPLLFLPAFAGAQSPAPAPAAVRIGIINIQQAIFATAEGKKASADLQKKFQPRQQDLQKQQQEIQNLQEQLQRQQTTLSDAERIRLNRELSEKQKLFDRAREDAQADFQEDRQDVISRVGQKMVALIRDYAQQNGYALVLDAQIPVVGTNQMADAQIPIYFATKDVDITDDIVKRYDSAFPAESAGAPGPSKPSAAPAKPHASPKPPPKPADQPKP